MKSQIRRLLIITLASLIGVSGCAVPRAIGKTAGGIVKGTGKVVSGTAKAVSAPLR